MGMRQSRAGEALSGRPAADSTVSNYLMSLSAAFTHAAKARWLRDNPVAAVPDKPAKRTRQKDFRLIDAERELPLFLETCQEVEPELLRFCVAFLETGARRNEMLAVRWRDVDLKSGMIWRSRPCASATRISSPHLTGTHLGAAVDKMVEWFLSQINGG